MKNFKELISAMTDEQKKESKGLYDKHYGEAYGNLDPVLSSSGSGDDIYYGNVIDEKDWN